MSLPQTNPTTTSPDFSSSEDLLYACYEPTVFRVVVRVYAEIFGVLVHHFAVFSNDNGVCGFAGGTLLYKAHALLETLCLDRDTQHYKALVADQFAELVYYG